MPVGASPVVASRIFEINQGGGSIVSAERQISIAWRTSESSSRHWSQAARCSSVSARRTASSCPSRYSLTRFSSSRCVIFAPLQPSLIHTFYHSCQFQPSAVDPRLHRALRNLKHLCDFGIIHVLQ